MGIVKGQLIDPWQTKIARGSEDDVCGMWGTAAGACDWPCTRKEAGGMLRQLDDDRCLIVPQRLWIFLHRQMPACILVSQQNSRAVSPLL